MSSTAADLRSRGRMLWLRWTDRMSGRYPSRSDSSSTQSARLSSVNPITAQRAPLEDRRHTQKKNIALAHACRSRCHTTRCRARLGVEAPGCQASTSPQAALLQEAALGVRFVAVLHFTFLNTARVGLPTLLPFQGHPGLTGASDHAPRRAP